ncbi:MAG: ATP-binding protein [Vicinamibacterales bacterium]
MLSIKQKQVLGVTSMVTVLVIVLSVLHLASLASTRLQESRARAELLAYAVYHQLLDVVSTQENAYQEIRSSRSVQSSLEAAIYSADVTDALIVDTTGTVVAASAPGLVGQTVPPRLTLTDVLASNPLAQLRAVYATGQTLELSQPIELAETPFGEIRIGLSPVLVRSDLNRALTPAALAAGASVLIAAFVSMLLAQIVLRPIHVIQSGLSRLGGGDLGARLDLRDEEFRDLGDVFDRLTAQLRAAAPRGVERSRMMELSRQVAALGRHTTGVAHEVKNPLNAMTIHLELLKQKLAGSEPSSAAPHADVIGQEIKRLDEVVQSFLAYVRPVEASFAPVAISSLLTSVLDAVRTEAERAGVTLNKTCGDATLQVEGDSTLLRQSFLNLAQNAIHAMPRGGVLSIACRALGDGRIAIRVEDSGSGIPPEHLSRIFDLYFTTKPRGTGAGLPVVSRTIELHNGRIDVESTVGKGTTFVVTLPGTGSTGAGATGSTGSTGAAASPSTMPVSSGASTGLQLR